MEQVAVAPQKQGTGMVAGIIACVLAALGILFLGIVFVPLATIVAIFGTVISIRNRNMGGIGVNALAWLLILVGFFTSPLLIGAVGAAFAG